MTVRFENGDGSSRYIPRVMSPLPDHQIHSCQACHQASISRETLWFHILNKRACWVAIAVKHQELRMSLKCTCRSSHPSGTCLGDSDYISHTYPMGRVENKLLVGAATAFRGFPVSGSLGGMRPL